MGGPGITGTRDSFGIAKSFRDDESGQVIDNWKIWERRGYKNALQSTRNHDMKEKIKGKIERIKKGHCNG